MKELETIVEKIKKRYKVYAVILFGSRARGDWMPWSDYDLLILADFKKKYLDRIGEILDLLIDVKLPIEPHPYTLNEAIQMLKRGNPIIIDAIEEGKILLSSDEFAKVLEIYAELKKKVSLRRKLL